MISGLSKPVKFLSFENCTPNFLEEGIASIEHLESIGAGNSLFNIYVDGNFLFPNFSTSDIIKQHLRNNNYGATEIFCHTVILDN